MELLVYGHGGARVLLFPTRTARFFDYEDWNVIQSLRPFIEGGQIQVFALDSIDQESFYCFWAHPKGRIERHLQFENYVLNEVIPFTQKLNSSNILHAVGCSMGAYHAMNIALRYPQLFNKVLCLSGRYDLTSKVGVFNNLLDGYFDEDVHYLMPSRYIPLMPEGDQLKKIRQLDITIAIGLEDAFYINNQEFSHSLIEKNIQHKFFEWEGMAHKAKYWKKMLPMYLEVN